MTADLLLLLVLALQHLPDDSLQGPAQVRPTVGLPDGRDVYEGGAPLAQVQRRVVGEVTEISEAGGRTKGTELVARHTCRHTHTHIYID